MLESLTGKEELKEELRKLKSQIEGLMEDQRQANEFLRKEISQANQSITRLS